MKITYDHILKFAAIFLTKVADFDILQALVQAKQSAPPELLPILDKIALMLNNIHNDSPDQLDEFANAVSGVGARYRDNEPIVNFLNGVLTILNGYLIGSYESEEEDEDPFAQIQEQQDYKEEQQMAGRSGKKQEWMTEYNKTVRNPKRVQQYAMIKFENPELHQTIKEDINFRKKKHRENLSPEELSARFKAHNDFHKEKWRKEKQTPEQKAQHLLKAREYKQRMTPEQKEQASLRAKLKKQQRKEELRKLQQA